MELTLISKLMLVVWMIAVGFVVYIVCRAIINITKWSKNKLTKSEDRKHATVVYPSNFFPPKR